MALKYAILGVLAVAPQHGHAVARRLRTELSGVWPVNHGQVYATLGRLARDGLVAAADVTGATPADRRRPFTLLPPGRRALRRWLEGPGACDVRRCAFATRLTLLVAAADRTGIARLLESHRLRCTTMLRLLDGAPARGLVAHAARRHLEAEIAWLARAAELLLAIPPRDGPAPP